MKQLILFSIFLASPLAAEGPLFRFKDSVLQQEFDNVYQDLRSIFTKVKKGRTDGVAASVGQVGEKISSSITSFTNFPASGNFGDLTSINLTAGHWRVDALVEAFANGATVTSFSMGIHTVSGNNGPSPGTNRAQCREPNASTDSTGSVPGLDVNISAAATYYLKYEANFTVATPQAVGFIQAVRVE